MKSWAWFNAITTWSADGKRKKKLWAVVSKRLGALDGELGQQIGTASGQLTVNVDAQNGRGKIRESDGACDDVRRRLYVTGDAGDWNKCWKGSEEEKMF